MLNNELSKLNSVLNETLNKNRRSRFRHYMDITTVVPAPAIQCVDGYTVSVQCSEGAYCTPRVSLLDVSEYEEFELGYPSSHDDLIEQYAENQDDQTDTVFPYVPREIVLQLIQKHGGIKEPEEDEALKMLFAAFMS